MTVALARPLDIVNQPTFDQTAGEPAACPQEVARRQDAAWQPTDRERLVYQWVRFDGEKQSVVAERLGIHQTSVSRILQRYERWLAHQQPGEDGRLVHQERLRVQRWLTFERNELMLAAALRIAGEMEGFADVSKSTVSRPASSAANESEIRTEHSRIDRSGVAARFLRLAFRINMEQLKLAELEELRPLPPLTAQELERGESQPTDSAGGLRCFPPDDAAVSTPPARAAERQQPDNLDAPEAILAAGETDGPAADDRLSFRESSSVRGATGDKSDDQFDCPVADIEPPSEAGCPVVERSSGEVNSPAVHTTHTAEPAESAVSAVVPTVNGGSVSAKKIVAYAGPPLEALSLPGADLSAILPHS